MDDITTDKLIKEVNAATIRLAGDPESYKDYLTWSGRFYNFRDPTNVANPSGGYTIANQLLIYTFNNKSRLCYTEEIWNKLGITVMTKDNPIYIIQHVKDKEFVPVVLYDIADTNAEQYRDITGKDTPSMCEALIMSSPCRIRYVKNLPRGKVMMSDEGSMIQVTKGVRNYDQMFIMLSQEIGHRYLFDYLKSESSEEEFEYRRAVHLYETYSAAYSVCAAFHMPSVRLFNIASNDKWKGTSPTDLVQIRKSMNMISNAARSIISNVTQELYAQQTAVYADRLYPENTAASESEVE